MIVYSVVNERTKPLRSADVAVALVVRVVCVDCNRDCFWRVFIGNCFERVSILCSIFFKFCKEHAG